jgi:hypothetical protein
MGSWDVRIRSQKVSQWWGVRVVDEHDKPESADISVPGSILSKMRPESIMLRGIAPYYNTTFNISTQVEFFIKEWEELAPRVEPEDKAIWQAVLDYAKRCLSPHTYLKFIGD